MRESRTVIEGSGGFGINYALKNDAGVIVPLKSAAIYYPDVSIVPLSSLTAATHYTFTITPPANLGDPYSFDFTTGPGPDKTPPQFIGFDPKSGTTGTGILGPFTIMFDKRLLSAFSLSGTAIVVQSGGAQVFSAWSLTADGKGIVVRPQPQLGTWPKYYQLTVDPAKIQDVSGNPGQGPAQSAVYLTFAATETSGPNLQGFFPADGETGIPLNAAIRLLFTQPVDSASAVTGLVLEADDAAVPVRVNQFASGYGVELKPQNLLAANQAYRVHVSAALTGLQGFGATPASFRFTTGNEPDVIRPQVIAYGPQSGEPQPANVLVALRANKRIMPLAAVQYSTLGTPEAFSIQHVTGAAAISSDGQTFSFLPRGGSVSGRYSVNLIDVVDVTGAPFANLPVTVQPGTVEDHDSPTLVAVNPPDGSIGVATDAPVSASFSEPVSGALSGDFARLSSNGQRIPAKFVVNGNLITIAAGTQMDPNTAYLLELNGIADWAGNIMPPYSFQFTTAGGTATGALHVLSTNPSNTQQGVAVNTSISFTFDAPLSPVSALAGFSISDSTFSSYPATAVVTGSTLTITPLHPLLHDSTIRAAVFASDTSGRYTSAQTQFRTGPNPDTSPFQVTAVSPPDGATIDSADRTITLTFSKAVNPASLPSALVVYSNGAVINAKVERGNGDLSLVITPHISTGDATLVLDSRVTDIAGNALAPFRAAFTFAPVIDTRELPSVLAMRPPLGSSGVAADTGITWFLSKPVDAASASDSLVVVADGYAVPGKFQVAAGGKTLMFRPDAPLPSGATVLFFQRTPFFGSFAGASGSFTIAPPNPSSLSVLRYTPVNLAPAGAVIEVEFSAEVSTGQALIALKPTGPTGPGPAIPTIESHPRPRVLRLKPVNALAPGSYVIVVSPKAGGGNLRVQLTAVTTTPEPAMLVGPVDGASGAPTNVSLRSAINVPLNPLTVTSSNLTLRSGGRIIPLLLYLSDFGLAATPVEELPRNATIEAAVIGLEDLFGRPIPSKSWTFTTAAGPDFTVPSLLESNVPDVQAELPANRSLVYRFDRPLDPQLTATPNPFTRPASVQYRLSDDLRTLTITPLPGWARGQFYSRFLPDVTDLAGNFTSIRSEFVAAFDEDRTPPQLLALSPADGAIGVPDNAQIIALFDEPVLNTTAGRVRLLRDDTAVPLVTLQDDLRRIRLSPKAPLAPRTAYTLVFEGIADLSGNSMTNSISRSFTTGDFLDSTQLQFNYSAATATNIPIRITFNKPVSLATVDQGNIALSKASAMASSFYWIPVATTYEISQDGRVVTVIPRDPLIPRWSYQLRIGSVRDLAGNSTSPLSAEFTAGDGPDLTPPTAIIIPADGTVGAPVNTRLGLVFYKPIVPPLPGSIFQITRDGQPVSGIAALTTDGVSFVPDFPLAPGATYRIDAGSVTDLAGNVSAPASSTFTTAETPNFNLFRLVSSAPGNNEAGVPVDSPVTMVFSKPVDPASIRAISLLTQFPTRGTYAVSGSTVTFTPSEPWPSAATVLVTLGDRSGRTVTDLAGERISFSNGFIFKTAVAPDPVHPQLVSISPAPGAQLPAGVETFRMIFSKTVIIPDNGLAVFNGSERGGVWNSYYDATDTRAVNVSIIVAPDTQLTLVSTDAIVDRNGNSVTPFSFQFPTGPAGIIERPSVTSVTPGAGAESVDPQAVIVVRFSTPMDPQTLNRAIRVTQDGENITGTLDFLDANRTAQFTPDKPYHAGSRIDVFVLETAADPNGLTPYQRYSTFFTVAGAPPKTISVNQTGFGVSVAPDASLELSFDRALDPKTVNTENVWLRAGALLLPGEVSLRSERILRFTPASPMAVGSEHVITVSAGLRAVDGTAVKPEEFRFQVAAGEAAELAAVEIGSWSEQPAIHVRFTMPVDPFSLDRIRLVDQSGLEIGAARRTSMDYRDVWLVPRIPGIDLDLATVQLEQVSDRAGRALKSESRRPLRVSIPTGK